MMKKTFFLLPVIALGVCAEVIGVEQLFNVKTTEAKYERVTSMQKNYGYIVADETHTHTIVTRFGGYVVELFADTRYKKVKKGEPLARVYSPEVLQAKEEYLNTYRYTQKRPSSAMLQSAMDKLLLLGISMNEIENIIETGKAEPYTVIYAPESGFIFEKNVEKGSAFNAKKKLFSLVNLDHVWVEARIYQNQIGSLESYSEYRVTTEAYQDSFSAKKAVLYPNLDPKDATATIRLEVDNAKNLLFPGMYVTVSAVTAEKTYLTLPRTAVIRKNGSWYVFKAGEFEGEYEPAAVGVTPISGDRYGITEGLEEGERVVNNALFMMDSDAQINGLYQGR